MKVWYMDMEVPRTETRVYEVVSAKMSNQRFDNLEDAKALADRLAVESEEPSYIDVYRATRVRSVKVVPDSIVEFNRIIDEMIENEKGEE